MIPQETQAYLDSFINYEKNLNNVDPAKFKLGRVRYLLRLLHNPQKDLKFIHIAGSKGKGSTCAFVAHILKCAGYKVGLWTSPHIQDFRERIRFLDPTASITSAKQTEDIFPDCISENDICSLIEEFKSSLEQAKITAEFGRLTYFEVLMGLALCHFQRQRADYVVLETGLGGRLDASNVVEALICGLTPISLEHTQLLGDTITAIAKEKAAIVKSEKQGVVVGAQEPEALRVIDERCRRLNIIPIIVGKDITYEHIASDIHEQIFWVKGLLRSYKLKTPLLGRYQIENAAMAVGMVDYLQTTGLHLVENAIENGIASTFWPGRFEVIRTEPLVILDSAHTPVSMKKFADAIRDILPGKNYRFVLGVSEDKDRKGICHEVDRVAKQVVLTQAHHPRAFHWKKETAARFFSKAPYLLIEDTTAALKKVFAEIEKDDVIVVTGSVFVVAEARKLLAEKYLLDEKLIKSRMS